MSAQSVRLFEQYRADQGRPVRKALSFREVAKRLREKAARDLADAAEAEAMADYLGEPK